MKKNILICGLPNTVLRILIATLKNDYTIYFLSYSKKLQHDEIKKILGNTAYLVETESGSKLAILYAILRLFILSFRIASNKNTQYFIGYHNHFIKNGLLMILLKWCFPRIKRIYFPYDIHRYKFPKELRYHRYVEKLRIKDKIHGRYSLFFDKICFRKAYKIITKGFENELSYLEEEYKILNKPHFVFNFLIEKKDLVEKQIQKLKKNRIDIVSIGGITNTQYGDNNYMVFEELLKNEKIFLHVYSHSSEILKSLTYHKNLLIHNYITCHNELIKEISQYDFGLSISYQLKQDCIQAKMASGVRIYDYLTAGLPIIIDREHTHMADIVTENNFGIVIPLNEIKDIMTHIKMRDYDLLLKSVKKNREKFIAETHKDDVLNFLRN